MNIIPQWDNLPAISWKNKVALLTYETSKLKQTECPVTHIFEPGRYIREMRIPQGTLFFGREHLLGHECQLNEGALTLVAPDGKFTFTGFASIHSKPGFHSVFYTLTDCVCRTVHPNPSDSRDIDALEKTIFGSAQDLIEKGRLVSDSLKELEKTCQA
jgi:hypothetical protein